MNSMAMKGNVYYKDQLAGIIEDTDEGFQFIYNSSFVEQGNEPISATLPLTRTPYILPTMIPFFDGLIPEGWLLDIAVEHWKIKANDRMRLLLTVCEDCIGAVSVKNQENEQ
jgi:serine/threonine-protein kinase HipA